MLLEAKNISFRYGKDTRQILENFSLSVESHERVGIIAPSGFGKTTFCKILAGYEKPDSGEVLLDGRPLSSYRGYCPVQMIWQHPEQVVNPRLHLRKVLEEGDGIDMTRLQSRFEILVGEAGADALNTFGGVEVEVDLTVGKGHNGKLLSVFGKI